jgi:rubrerythrin
MINKTKSLSILNGITFASLLAASLASAMEPQGSEEVLSHKAIKGHDIHTGMPFRVYESVRNQTFEKQKNFSKMTFYIAPLFRLIPDSITQQPYRRLVLESEGIVRYTFLAECFHPRLDRQALQSISNHYAQSAGDFEFQLNKIQPMEHGMVVIKPSLPGRQLREAIKPARKPANPDAPLNTILTLKAKERFDLEVPLELDDLFQQVLGEQGTGIEFDFTTYFNVMNLRIKQIVWRADHIRKSEAYQELTGRGAKYYDANQVRSLLEQVAREVGAFDYQDPGIEDQLDDKVREVFDRLSQRTQEFALNSYAEAEAFEAKLLEGTGLSLNEFKPITLMWKVSHDIENMTDHKKANKALQKAYKNQRDALQKELENYQRRKNSFSASGSSKTNFAIPFFSVGGSISVSYSKSSDVMNRFKQAIDKLDHQINDDTFEDEEQFQEYKKKRTKREGQEVKIVGRGLNLIEKNHLDRNLSALGGYLAVRPFHEAKTFNISSRLQPEQVPQTRTFDNFQLPLSLSKNTPFIEVKATYQRQTHQSRSGFTQQFSVEAGDYLISFRYQPPKSSFYHFLVLKNNRTQTEIVDNSGNIAFTLELEPRDRVQLQIDCHRSYCQTGVLAVTELTVTKKPFGHRQNRDRTGY